MDIVGEDEIDTMMTAMEGKGGQEQKKGEIKMEMGDMEAPPLWERETSAMEKSDITSSNW